MSVSRMKREGYELPEPETAEGLDAQKIVECMRSYLEACEHASGEGNMDGIFDSYFMELLATYPKSMCSHQLGPALGFLMALLYEDGLPTQEDVERHRQEVEKYRELGYKGSYVDSRSEPQPDFTFENLALIFNCSKSTVHDSIRKHGVAAKKAVQDVRLHRTAKEIALAELVKEEKQKLLQNSALDAKEGTGQSGEPKEQNSPKNQTNVHIPYEEDI